MEEGAATEHSGPPLRVFLDTSKSKVLGYTIERCPERRRRT